MEITMFEGKLPCQSSLNHINSHKITIKSPCFHVCFPCFIHLSDAESTSSTATTVTSTETTVTISSTTTSTMTATTCRGKESDRFGVLIPSKMGVSWDLKRWMMYEDVNGIVSGIWMGCLWDCWLGIRNAMLIYVDGIQCYVFGQLHPILMGPTASSKWGRPWWTHKQ